MLLEMRIENFILIEKLNLTFSDKLNVFTGETGAGKSMIIGGLNVGLGEKVTSDVIRKGAAKAVIQLVFSVKKHDIVTQLEEYGIELEEDLLIITREVLASNRSVIRMNGRIATISTLRAISSFLMDVHGQHAHQTLLYPKNHLYYLDLMGDKNHLKIKDEVADAYKHVKQIQSELQELLETSDQSTDTNYIKFQIDEIDACHVSEEDDDALNKKYEYYKNIEQIHRNVSSITQMLSGEDETTGIKELLTKCMQMFSEVASFDEKLKSLNDQLNDVYYSIDDIQSEIRHFSDDMDVDEEEMYQTEQRMNAVNELKLKHGRTVSDILLKRTLLIEQLERFENRESVIADLNKQQNDAKKTYLKLARNLQTNRLMIKSKFVTEVKLELERLNMDNCQFDVLFAENKLSEKEFRLSVNGFDQVEFLISTNPGMPLSPLAKVASGGEISRIMLAIKVALSNNDIVGCLVFDEVDTGISGATAIIVGEKIQSITSNYQILCITHLPQIAVMADQHFLLSKSVENNMTYTNVEVLNNQSRLNEIARMLSGDETSTVSIRNAQEMVLNANTYKNIS